MAFEENLEAIKSNTTPLSSKNTGELSAEDLANIKTHVEDKKLVAVGESSHGTREFFQVKKEIFKYLASELGYCAFLLETPYCNKFGINKYTKSGSKDLEDAINSLSFSVWRTKEIADLLEWIKKFNDERPEEDRITVYGFDIQKENRCAKKLLSEIDRDKLSEEQKRSLEYLATEDSKAWKDPDTEKLQQSIQSLEVLYKRLVSENSSNFDANPVSNLIEGAKFALKTANEEDPINYRDRSMAENIKRIINSNEIEKAFIWAHNSHVSKKEMILGDKSYVPMGKHLDDRFGDQYLAIAQEFGLGEIRTDSEEIENPEYKELKNQTLSENLMKLDSEISFIDLENPDSEIVDTKIHSIGSTPRQEQIDELYVKKNFSENFDALIFVKNSTASRPFSSD